MVLIVANQQDFAESNLHQCNQDTTTTKYMHFYHVKVQKTLYKDIYFAFNEKTASLKIEAAFWVYFLVGYKAFKP